MDPDVEHALLARTAAQSKGREEAKREAIMAGLFEALIRARNVMPVRIGDRRSYARISPDHRVLLVRLDGTVIDALAGVPVWTPPILTARSPIETAFLGSPDWLREAEDPIWAAFMGPTRPSDLRQEHLLHWLRCEAIKAAEASLLDRPYPAGSTGSRDAQPEAVSPDTLLVQPDPDSVEVLESFENAEEARFLTAALFAAATPREQELIQALLRFTDADDRALAAQLGVQPSTIRVMRRNLREKLYRLA